MSDREIRTEKLILGIEKTDTDLIKEAYLTDSAEALLELKNKKKSVKRRVSTRPALCVRVIAASLCLCLMLAGAFVLIKGRGGWSWDKNTGDGTVLSNSHDVIQLPLDNAFSSGVGSINTSSDIKGVYFSLEKIEEADGFFSFDLLLHNDSTDQIYVEVSSQLQKHTGVSDNGEWKSLSPAASSDVVTAPAIWSERVISKGETLAYRCSMKYYGETEPGNYRFGVSFDTEPARYNKTHTVYFEFSLKDTPDSIGGTENCEPIPPEPIPPLLAIDPTELRDVYGFEIYLDGDQLFNEFARYKMVNGVRLAINSQKHVPVMKVASVEDAEELRNILSPSKYSQICDGMDEEYFKNYTFYFAYVSTRTMNGEYTSRLTMENGEIVFHIACLKEGAAEALSGWFFCAAFPNEKYGSVTMVDAIEVWEIIID